MISSLPQRIFKWLVSRTLWRMIGVVALSLLIWYAGPLFAFGDARPLESAKTRGCLIGLVLAYFLLPFVFARWRAKRMNERIVGMLRATLGAMGQHEEAEHVGILRDRFAEALDVLRKAHFKEASPSRWKRILRHGRYVYELPWYILLGAPGVGKTTALLNCGLSFPLAKQIGAEAIRGAGGTKNCAWWFTNEAVFIDTAGRYTTHDSDAKADQAEWRAFLSLLKKTRNRKPINGALVMLSVTDLLELTLKPESRQSYVATLHRRLDELRDDLGTVFPVYLLINKCDLLLGFNEYFSSLDRAGREQVWGFTFPFPPSGTFHLDPAQLAAECKLLQARITAGLVDTLQAEHDLDRRTLIYAFPQQFGILIRVLREIAPELFSTSRFSASPLLRGIYFTSATQDGKPFDRLVHALRQGSPMPSPQKAAVAGEGKAYFFRDLLAKVVFTEAHITGSDKRAERRSRAWHVCTYAFCVATLCGAVLVWGNSYRNNLTYLAEVGHKTTSFESELNNLPERNDTNVHALLPILGKAEALPDSAIFGVDRPLISWRFGLYQGEKLKAGARPLYEQLLEKRFGPTIKANLEQWLRSVDIGDLEFSYELLKAYVMMHEPKHFDAREFNAFVETLWGHDFPEGTLTGERQALARHLTALIDMNAMVPTTPMEASLVQSTRARLTQYTTSQRVYYRLQRLLQNNQLPEFSVASEVGTKAAQVLRFKSGQPLTHGVPSLYTYRGYHELFKGELDRVLNFVRTDELWVLGVTRSERESLQNIASGKLALDVKRNYVADYISHWEKYIDDFTIVEPGSLREAAQIVDNLSGVDSPLLRFMQGVVRETTLLKETAPTASQQSMFNRAQRVATATMEDMKRIVPQGTIGVLEPKEIPEIAVNNRFAALRAFVNGGGDGANSPMLQAAKKLEDLRGLLAVAINRAENGLPMPETTTVTQLMIGAESTPEPFRKILKAIATSSGNNIRETGTAITTRTMVGDVTSFCQKTIEGRYPFSRAPSAIAVTAADFAEMFGPGGRIEKFHQEQRPGTQLPPAFEQARVIRDVFFRNGNTPQISFTVKPLVIDNTIVTLTMDIGGQTVRYAHGPRVSTSVMWPAAGGHQQVRVTLAPPIPHGTNEVTTSGLWALHQLFGKYGRIEPGVTPDVFNIRLDVGGRTALFEIKPTSIQNPFNLREFSNFRCPQTLK